MDPRKLFSDDRLRGICTYCCRTPNTRDHVPSRILLDDPLPSNTPVVESCHDCNKGFSLDEEYFAAFLECAISGSTDPDKLSRPKIADALRHSPALASLIASSEVKTKDGQQIWQPDQQRVANVVEKLARGHAAFELNVIPAGEPSIKTMPLMVMSDEQRNDFLNHQPTPFIPEIGSRAFIRACKNPVELENDLWQSIQPDRYEYLVSQCNGTNVRLLFSNYLGCEVNWH